MSKFQLSIGILVLSVFLASISQIFLKVSANKTYSSRIREYLNIHVMIGYGLLFVSTILTMIGLRYVPLSWQPMIESLSYIFVSGLGYLILKEKFGRRKLLGLGVILVGVFVFSVL
ncbi:MAG: EamA family transporter [Eubacteriales bacterium]|nr:EamA family transporter [Eubacteriales bacterium]